ncbi:hypothetical protein BN77_2222 [Rhizobium mesoamericanum STM3625]|uniref:Uncharacterized protein n=1 Tax=Rhizobium mesoamericanum STM3625 TaxID=1211777 RepID=K0PYL6_9HYPH|nr:hypothetical protein BN77_2222 [Rhizobium mesoamericanum STM3625]
MRDRRPSLSLRGRKSLPTRLYGASHNVSAGNHMIAGREARLSDLNWEAPFAVYFR